MILDDVYVTMNVFVWCTIVAVVDFFVVLIFCCDVDVLGFVGYRRNNRVFLQEADVRGRGKSNYKKFSA